MRNLSIADIHGRYKEMLAVLDLANYNPQSDSLITLGDEVDGGPDSFKVIDYLSQQPNVIKILGNHDFWLVNYIKTTVELPVWTHQGGYATLWSYEQENHGKIPFHHAEFLHRAKPYYIDSKNRVFVHGGFIPCVPLEEQDIETIIWDRQLIEYAMCNPIKEFNHVYVGHTSTLFYDSYKPITFNNLTMLDTGGGWPGGYITVMDVDTREFWQCEVIL